MRAISLWQPWASFVAAGFKTIETRRHDRFRNLVGERIAIHAARRFDAQAFVEIDSFLRDAGFPSLSFVHRSASGCLTGSIEWPAGAIVGTARVGESRRLTVRDEPDAMRHCAGAWGLFLECSRRLAEPSPFTGRQGIFNVPDEIIPAYARGRTA